MRDIDKWQERYDRATPPDDEDDGTNNEEERDDASLYRYEHSQR
jgi:hypothetical protein